MWNILFFMSLKSHCDLPCHNWIEKCYCGVLVLLELDHFSHWNLHFLSLLNQLSTNQHLLFQQMVVTASCWLVHYLKVYLQSSCYGNRDRFILWWYFGGPALWIFTFPWVAVWHEMHWSIFKIPYLKSHIYALSLSIFLWPIHPPSSPNPFPFTILSHTPPPTLYIYHSDPNLPLQLMMSAWQQEQSK